MARKMNNMTQGLYNFVNHALKEVEKGNLKEAEYVLIDLLNDIGGAYVCKNRTIKTGNSLPVYNPKTDGNYTKWLVSNNMD